MANMPPVGIIKVSTGGSFLPFSPRRPGAFSCPHSPRPLVQIISCASVASLRPLYGVIGEMSTPGCRREQICSWAILRGVGGMAIYGSVMCL